MFVVGACGLGLLIASSTGCSHGPKRPQTTEEFRAQVLADRNVRIERWVVTDSFDAVSERLRYAFMSCFERVDESCNRSLGARSASPSCG